MRAHLLTALLSLFVLCTSASAYAGERVSTLGHCSDHPMPVAYASLSSQEIVVEGKTSAKASSDTRMVSVPPRPSVQAHIPLAQAPLAPGQSRAPTMCSDPRQPGCQLQAPDAPHHGSFESVAVDAGMFTRPFDGIGPGVMLGALPIGEALGTPADGHLRAMWRPPAR